MKILKLIAYHTTLDGSKVTEALHICQGSRIDAGPCM